MVARGKEKQNNSKKETILKLISKPRHLPLNYRGRFRCDKALVVWLDAAILFVEVAAVSPH